MKRFAFVVLSFCACALAGSTAHAANADVSIKFGGNEYHPDTVHLRVGETVTWTNDDRTLLPTNHTVTADDGSFDSGVIRERNSFDYTFTRAGSFTYHCSIHAGMSGTVVVAARPSRSSTPTVAPTKTRTSPKPSASKSATASASRSSAASSTPSIDPSSRSNNTSSAGTIISIAIVSIAVLIGLGYFVYVRLVRDR